MNGLLAILLIGVFPFKNSYVGFRVTSFSHLPGNFVVQVPVGGLRISPDIGVNYENMSVSAGSTDSTSRRNIEIDAGVSLLVPVYSRTVGGRKLTGILGVRPGIHYANYLTKAAFGTPDSVRTEDMEYSGTFTLGAEYNIDLFGLESAVQLTTNLMSLSYIDEKVTQYSGSNSHVTNQNQFNFQGLNIFTGTVAFWLLFKL